MPCFRDPDNLVYGKSESGGIMFGGYEPDPVARWIDGVPWDHGEQSLPPDLPRFEPLLRGAARRFPFLADAEIVKLVCHPDAMTPDAQPLLGPIPGVHGFWMAAGLSLNGFGGAGGIGQDHRRVDHCRGARARRHRLPGLAVRAGPRGSRLRGRDLPVRHTGTTTACATRCDTDEWGRPHRTGPLHGRLQDLGCVFGAKNGWERPDFFEPGRPWRRAGADQRRFGWTAPPWFERLRSEHTAFRERVGIIDMSSFGKIEVSGPGALDLLERVCDNLIDRPVGSVVYTQFLNPRGGIVADVTVTRLDEDRFRVVTGAGFVDGDLGWLRMGIRAGDAPVEIRDVTAEHAVIGLWGPAARAILGATTGDDVSSAGLPFRTARGISIHGAPVLVQRITYVGELGYELYVEPGWAVQVWDRLFAAGRSTESSRAATASSSRCGWRRATATSAPTSARSTPRTRPGSASASRSTARATSSVATLSSRRAVSRPERTAENSRGRRRAPLTLYGGEAVHAGGQTVGRLRSCAYGYTVGAHPRVRVSSRRSRHRGSRLEVEMFGEMVPAEVAADVLYDPDNARIRPDGG